MRYYTSQNLNGLQSCWSLDLEVLAYITNLDTHILCTWRLLRSSKFQSYCTWPADGVILNCCLLLFPIENNAICRPTVMSIMVGSKFWGLSHFLHLFIHHVNFVIIYYLAWGPSQITICYSDGWVVSKT